MRRPALALLPLAALATSLSAVLASCGGGGGDPSPGGNSGPDVTALNNVRTEAVLGAQPIDSTNIFFGERVQFTLLGFTDAGAETSVAPSGWTTTLPANVGTITRGGLFTAGSALGTGTVSVTVRGKTFTGTVTVKGGATFAVLTGRVRLVGGAPVARVGLRALNAAGTEVGSGFSAKDGTVRIAVPTTSRRLNLNFDTIDPKADIFVRQFALGDLDYSTVIPGCTAPLPALAGGGAALPSSLVVYALGAGAPPPPPDGCSATP